MNARRNYAILLAIPPAELYGLMPILTLGIAINARGYLRNHSRASKVIRENRIALGDFKMSASER